MEFAEQKKRQLWKPLDFRVTFKFASPAFGLSIVDKSEFQKPA
jgi:hypothetical protein